MESVARIASCAGANEDLFQRSAAESETKSGPTSAAALAPKLSPHAARQRTRPVWNNPILWREIRTRAYGRKILAIRLAYLLLFALAAVGVHSVATGTGVPRRWRERSNGAADSLVLHLAPLVVLSLILVNALAVTSITTERDLGALDLLLVTDLAPAEFIFGKLGGIFYVAKEMILLPLLLLVYLYFVRAASAENLVYLLLALLLNYTFVATLGIHAGLTYANSRHAVAVSLGTVFFLLVGIGICMRIMMSFSGSFELQLTPFLVFMVGGGICMFVALGVRNPSAAIGWASFACPLFTFVAITSYLQEQTLGLFLIICRTYGFTTAAMLIPAIYEFDVATGRTSGAEESRMGRIRPRVKRRLRPRFSAGYFWCHSRAIARLRATLRTSRIAADARAYIGRPPGPIRGLAAITLDGCWRTDGARFRSPGHWIRNCGGRRIRSTSARRNDSSATPNRLPSAKNFRNSGKPRLPRVGRQTGPSRS